MLDRARVIRLFILGCVMFSVAVVFATTMPMVRALVDHTPVRKEKPPVERADLVADEPETLRLSKGLFKAQGIKAEPVEPAPPPAALRMHGKLFLDPNRLARVHTRFAGEVVAVGMVDTDLNDPRAWAEPGRRQVRFGDRVITGQLLAVIWSKDLGEKKSEMVDALSRLTLDQETLRRLQELYNKGAVPERSLREAERNVEADLIVASRVENTLHSWRVSDAEIDELRDEAKRIHTPDGKTDKGSLERWARVEVTASFGGIVVERNVCVGDTVDTSLDLFKIVNLTRLDVMANAYEEDIKLLEELKVNQRHWDIHLQSKRAEKPLVGSFDQIGNLIDPDQHTALVRGWVNNENGKLRVGQFVDAVVSFPAFENEVVVPLSAVIDRGGDTYVFVQPDANDLRFSRRHVAPIRRRDGKLYVSAKVTPEQTKAGRKPLAVGEQVVVSGTLDLASELEHLEGATVVASK